MLTREVGVRLLHSLRGAIAATSPILDSASRALKTSAAPSEQYAHGDGIEQALGTATQPVPALGQRPLWRLAEPSSSPSAQQQRHMGTLTLQKKRLLRLRPKARGSAAAAQTLADDDGGDGDSGDAGDEAPQHRSTSRRSPAASRDADDDQGSVFNADAFAELSRRGARRRAGADPFADDADGEPPAPRRRGQRSDYDSEYADYSGRGSGRGKSKGRGRESRDYDDTDSREGGLKSRFRGADPDHDVDAFGDRPRHDERTRQMDSYYGSAVQQRDRKVESRERKRQERRDKFYGDWDRDRGGSRDRDRYEDDYDGRRPSRRRSDDRFDDRYSDDRRAPYGRQDRFDRYDGDRFGPDSGDRRRSRSRRDEDRYDDMSDERPRRPARYDTERPPRSDDDAGSTRKRAGRRDAYAAELEEYSDSEPTAPRERSRRDRRPRDAERDADGAVTGLDASTSGDGEADDMLDGTPRRRNKGDKSKRGDRGSREGREGRDSMSVLEDWQRVVRQSKLPNNTSVEYLQKLAGKTKKLGSELTLEGALEALPRVSFILHKMSTDVKNQKMDPSILAEAKEVVGGLVKRLMSPVEGLSDLTQLTGTQLSELLLVMGQPYIDYTPEPKLAIDIVQELGKDSCSKMLAASERSLVQAFNGLAGIQAKLRPTAAGNPATPADSPGTAVEPKAGSSFGESLPASGVLFNNSDSALQLEGAAEQLVNSVVEVVKNHAGALTADGLAQLVQQLARLHCKDTSVYEAAAQSLSSRASELNPVSVNQLGLTSRYLVNQDLYVPALLDLNKELTIQQIESVSPNAYYDVLKPYQHFKHPAQDLVQAVDRELENALPRMHPYKGPLVAAQMVELGGVSDEVVRAVAGTAISAALKDNKAPLEAMMALVHTSQVLQANRIYDPALFDSLCDAGLHVLKTFVASGNTTPPTRRVRMEHMLPELHNNIASMGHVHTAMQSYVSEWFLQRDQSNQSASRDATEHGLLLFQTSSAAANLVALADTRAATQAQSDPAAQEGLKEVKSAAERLLVESTQAQLMHAERLMVARDKQAERVLRLVQRYVLTSLVLGHRSDLQTALDRVQTAMPDSGLDLPVYTTFARGHLPGPETLLSIVFGLQTQAEEDSTHPAGMFQGTYSPTAGFRADVVFEGSDQVVRDLAAATGQACVGPLAAELGYAGDEVPLLLVTKRAAVVVPAAQPHLTDAVDGQAAEQAAAQVRGAVALLVGAPSAQEPAEEGEEGTQQQGSITRQGQGGGRRVSGTQVWRGWVLRRCGYRVAALTHEEWQTLKNLPEAQAAKIGSLLSNSR